MKIFITGATGFIGKQVLNRLTGTGHVPVCLVRKSNTRFEDLKASGVNVVAGDVRDKNSLLEGMKGCDSVINLANIYTFWEPDNSVYSAVNIQGTRNVMEAALETKVTKVVHISSVVSYGKTSDIPFTEESEPGKVWYSKYARSKNGGDTIVWEMYRNKGLPVVMIYPGAVLGAGDPKASGSYVAGIVKKTLPATVFRKSVLTWVHVNDVADGIVKALEKPGNTGQKYILAKHMVNLNDFNAMIMEISGVSLPFISMPDFLAMGSAYMFTGLANIIKRPPVWNMAVDQMKTMKKGFVADGSKAERELGVKYAPLRTALEEEIAMIRNS